MITRFQDRHALLVELATQKGKDKSPHEQVAYLGFNGFFLLGIVIIGIKFRSPVRDNN